MAVLAKYTYGGDIRATAIIHGPEGKTLNVDKLIPSCQKFMQNVIREKPEYLEKLKENMEDSDE